MEKLYREIKCSDRLPKEGMEFFVTETNKYLLQTSGILEDGQWFDVRNGNEIDVDTWLEPIPSPEPSINTDEMKRKTERLFDDFKVLSEECGKYSLGFNGFKKAIAQLFNQQPTLVLPTEDEISKVIRFELVFIHYDACDRTAKAIIELIKSKQL